MDSLEVLEITTLPKEMIAHEINKWLLEIDRQILRKVNKYFNDIFPFIRIYFDEIDLQIPHLKRYKKLWTNSTAKNIATWGRLECLKYVHTQEVHTQEDFLDKYPWNIIPVICARHGHLECLKYAYSIGCKWNEITTAWAAQNGRLECLKYVHTQEDFLDKYPWNIIPVICARHGHLECLKYAYSIGCKWNEMTTAWAAQNGRLECLKYARDPKGDGSGDGGCPWNNAVPADAAWGGHLECLKYAHENGCDWDTRTTSFAAENGHLECLKYAIDNGCPWNALTLIFAKNNKHFDCFEYALKNGCPKPN